MIYVYTYSNYQFAVLMGYPLCLGVFVMYITFIITISNTKSLNKKIPKHYDSPTC